jgi:hypothetical protein
VLAAHDGCAVAEVAEDVLHGALAQCDPHGEGQLLGVQLLVAPRVQELAAG